MAMRLIAALLVMGSTVLAPSAGAQVGTVRFASSLQSPTFLTAPPGDLGRVFVVERAGQVEILDVATGLRRAAPFLSIPGVNAAQGFLGLAFHPDYAINGRFYVYYGAGGTARLVRYQRSAGNPDLANPASAQLVAAVGPIVGDHIGGWIGFAPDGTLYWQVGDGGYGGYLDVSNYGQTVSGELLGSVLRIDVDRDDFPGDANRNYGIPADNPFVGAPGEDEIWSYGLRNPYRGSFDRWNGDYVIADVGENSREEIDFQRAGNPGGQNYGWRLREGTIATPGGVGGPQPPGALDPNYDYAHGTGPNQGDTVIGGYVYRGPVSELRGRYFFGDFVNPRIWSLRIDRNTGSANAFEDWTAAFVPDIGEIDQLVSFGEDAAANLYLVDLDGEIFRVTGPTSGIPALSDLPLALVALCLSASGAAALRSRARARMAAAGPSR
jgi:glucose/arabinose dehydrogenase